MYTNPTQVSSAPSPAVASMNAGQRHPNELRCQSRLSEARMPIVRARDQENFWPMSPAVGVRLTTVLPRQEILGGFQAVSHSKHWSLALCSQRAHEKTRLRDIPYSGDVATDRVCPS